MGSLWKFTPIDLYLHHIVCNIFVLFPHRTWCWMFRHSDGNKNSWEEEKANKAFLSIHHHQGTMPKTASFFFQENILVLRISENVIVWSRGRRPQKSGISRELPRLTFAPSYRRICPPMRICFALAAQFLLKI